LQTEVLFIEEDRVPFTMREMDSCVRLD